MTPLERQIYWGEQAFRLVTALILGLCAWTAIEVDPTMEGDISMWFMGMASTILCAIYVIVFIQKLKKLI